MKESNNCDQNITAKKCDDNVTKYHEVLITRPVGEPFKLQEDKCEDCIIGYKEKEKWHGGYEDASYNYESKISQYNKRWDFDLIFKHCPECGHKIDWEKLDA